jgi:GNAT superfamily N-acetyltransferase
MPGMGAPRRGVKIRAVQVRPAVPSDRGLIWALNGIPHVGATADPSFPLPLRPRDVPPTEFPDLADVPDSFRSAGGNFLVVEEHGQIVGMGGYKRIGEDSAQVLRVRVHPAVRRRGVARNVMEAIEALASADRVRRMVVETAQNQPEAISFYEAIGYRQTGTETRPEWTWTLVWFERILEESL